MRDVPFYSNLILSQVWATAPEPNFFSVVASFIFLGFAFSYIFKGN